MPKNRKKSRPSEPKIKVPKPERKKKEKTPEEMQIDEELNIEDKTEWWEKETITYACDEPLSSGYEPLLDLSTMEGTNQLNQPESEESEETKKKKKKKRRKIVHRVVTREMAQAEVHRKQVDSKIYRELSIPLPTEYGGPQIDLSFNLPRVTAQLEKLMGTNVVRLTDRKYMQELQKRIKEDYCATLEKRISNRVLGEMERQKHLILNGSYTPANCPASLIPLHSIVLAKEMDREKNLLLHGQGEKLPGTGNSKSQDIISRKRAKLKTVREKNAERLVKQGMKWEKERLLQEEQDRLREIEAKQRREKLLETEQLYTLDTNDKGVDLQRIKSRKFTEPEIDLKNFLLTEREANARKQSQSLDPIQNIQAMMSAKSFMKKVKKKKEEREEQAEAQVESMAGKQTPESPEEGYVSSATEKSRPVTPSVPRKDDEKGAKVKLPVVEKKEAPKSAIKEGGKSGKAKKEVTILPTVVSGSSTDATTGEMTDEQHQQKLEAKLKEEEAKGNMMGEPKFKLLHYEDPRIVQLKLTDKVSNMYELADDIIIGDLKRKT